MFRWSPLIGDGPGLAERRNEIDQFISDIALGDGDGEIRQPVRGATAPKLTECKFFYNPIYRYIYIKNTKVAGSSVVEALAPFCPNNFTAEDAMVPFIRM